MAHTGPFRLTRRGNVLALGLLAVSAACQTAAPVVPSPTASSPPDTTPAPSSSARGSQGPLTLYYWQAPTIVNPHLSAGTKDLSASRITYEPLASFDKHGAMVPFLAAEIPSLENGGVASDGRSVTWKLKSGVRWSDGEPFTADDVKFTFDYATSPAVRSTSGAAFTSVASVDAVDPTTVRVNFKAVQPAWSTPFTGVQGMIIPRHVFEPFLDAGAADAPPNLAPVGTGPFRVVEFSAEDILVVGGSAVTTTRIVYEANPYFRDPDQPAFSRVELRGGGGDAAFAAQLVKDGLVDFAWNMVVSEDRFREVEAGGKARLEVAFGAFVERIMVNFTDPNRETASGERSSVEFPHPFLTDKRVRQAISLAIDRDKVAAGYGRGGRATTNLVVSPATFASPNTSAVFDLKRAAALLDEAGWKDSDGDGVRDKAGASLSVLFQTSINPVRQRTQSIVEEALESIGFDVALKNIDSGLFLGPVEGTTDTRRQFYADLEEFAYSNKAPDPGPYLKGWTCGEVAQQANDWALTNWGRYCNPAYDALYEQSTRVIDPIERQALFIAMNDLLIEDIALIPLVHQAEVSGVALSLDGVDVSPWDVEIWNIAEWRRK